ncbi:MAG TPA: hypothetical protein VED59_03140 [Acidimicrobiales bacterium]|nr:hypothetical protein [Acidimicrobiales bacterium]
MLERATIDLSLPAALCLSHWLTQVPASVIPVTHPAERQALADLLTALESQVADADAVVLAAKRAALLRSAGRWVYEGPTFASGQDANSGSLTEPIGVEHFHHDGRGPELWHVHWGLRGKVLRAIDYFNPEVEYDASHLRHVAFIKPQVVMITPEEVIGGSLGDALSRHRPAAAFDRGQDAWLGSFSPRHLAACRHYSLVFYDELIDVICEGLEFRSGGFTPSETERAQSAIRNP